MNPNIPVREVQPSELNYKNFVKRTALNSDIEDVIRESVVITENGKIKIIYLDLDEVGLDCKQITEAVKKIRYETNERTGGLKTTSRIFGFAPRVTLRKDFCSSTSLAREFPKEHGIICDYADKIADIYLNIDPDTFNRHKEMTDKVLPEWKIKRSLFTSGIVNKNNPLKYHFDAGNFKDVYSCMLGFKSNVEDVGSNAGGCQDFDRKLESERELVELRKIYPALKFKEVTGKRWLIEPDLNDKFLHGGTRF